MADRRPAQRPAGEEIARLRPEMQSFAMQLNTRYNLQLTGMEVKTVVDEAMRRAAPGTPQGRIMDDISRSMFGRAGRAAETPTGPALVAETTRTRLETSVNERLETVFVMDIANRSPLARIYNSLAHLPSEERMRTLEAGLRLAEQYLQGGAPLFMGGRQPRPEEMLAMDITQAITTTVTEGPGRVELVRRYEREVRQMHAAYDSARRQLRERGIEV
ncbi:MAG: hypothetical protein MN733_37180 [Nitrososphaera sp.]|nr:hypothetical protein [Nitrososphaera sp.]